MRKRFLPVLLVICLMMNLLPASTLAAGNGNDVLVKESGLEMMPEKTTSEEQGGGIAADGQGESATDMPGTDVEVEALDQGATAETQEENSAADSLETGEMFNMQGEGIETDMQADEETGESGSPEIVDSGACGENVSWVLDSEGTLIISGTGAMDSAPWNTDANRSEIRKIVIQNGVTNIGMDAFHKCLELKSAEIPNSVIDIDERAFFDCGLETVEIPDSVLRIGYQAFFGCDGLKSVEIPNSITSIASGLFQDCSNLESVEIPNSVTYIGSGAFERCSHLESVEIPDSVTEISGYAFYGCRFLHYVEIPNSVTEIGGYAFSECSSLTSVEIPNSITRIVNCTFSKCSSLTSVEIPKSVTNIAWGAFSGCSSLASVKIPDSVTEIGSGVFSGCSSLTDVYYSGSKDEWEAIEVLDSYLLSANIHFNSTGPEGGDIPDDTLIVTEDIELDKTEEFEFPFTFSGKEFNNDLLAIVVQDESIVSASIKDLEVTDEGYAGFELSKKMSGVLVFTGVDIGETEVLLGYPGCAVAYKFKVSVINQGSEGGEIVADPDKIIISGNGSIRVGETIELSAEIIYNTTHNDDSIEWTSSNSTVVAFEGDKGSVTNQIETISNGKADDSVQIHALSVGRATITCRLASGATQIFKVVVQAEKQETTKLQDYVIKWRTAYATYMGALEEALKGKSSEISKVTIDEQAEALMEADAKSNSKLVVFNGQYDETVQMNVYKAVADFLADNTAQSINLGNINVSGVDVISIAASIVNSIYKPMDTKSYTYKYGKATIRIEGISSSEISARKISYQSGKVKTQFVATLVSTKEQAQKAVTAYLKELVKLEKNLISEAYSQMAKSIFGKDINGLVKEKVAKVIAPYIDAITNTGLGKVDVAMNSCLNYYSYAKKIMDMANQNPAELTKTLSSMKTFTFEDTSIKEKFVKSAMKGLEKAKKELNEAFEAYIYTGKVDAGTLIDNWFKETFTGIKNIFKCPVDIAIYDSSGEQVGFVGEGEIWFNEDTIYIEQYGDTKTIYSNKADLNFDITGTDYGFLNCTFEEWENGVAIERVNYYDIPLYEGKSLSASAPGRNVTTETVIVRDHDTGVVPADENIRFEDYETVTVHINCIVSGEGGQVYGAGEYVRGDAVNIHAAEEEGYIFFGWQNSDGALESTSNVYEFTAREDIALTALFAEYVEDSGSVQDIYTVTFDGNGGIGVMEPVTVENGEVFTFPSCDFTAPDGYQFKAWRIGDREFISGDNFTVEEDIIVSAYWIKKATSTPEPDPTASPAPVQTVTPEPGITEEPGHPTVEPSSMPDSSPTPTSEPPAGETPKPSLVPTSEPPVVETPEPSPIPTSEPAVAETPDSGQESTPEPSETLKPVEMPTEAPTATPEAGVDKKPAATVAPNPSQMPPSEPNQIPDPDNGELSSGAATDSSSGSGHESSVSSHLDNKDSSTNSPRTGEDSSILWLAALILITGGVAAVIKIAEELKRNH